MIDVDPTDDFEEVVEESSSVAEDVDAGGFELRKRAHVEGTSASGTAGKDPHKDEREEKCQKVRQDKAPSMATQSSSTA